MKKIAISLFFLGSVFSLLGQNLWEQKITLFAGPDLQSSPLSNRSEIFEYPGDWREGSFIGFSAYTLDTSVALELWWRYESAAGWSTWQALERPESGTLGRQAFAAAPVMEKIKRYQLAAQAGVFKDFTLELRFFSPGEASLQEIPTGMEQSPASCNCPQPTWCDRSCWCPSGNCPPPSSYDANVPSHFIIHHSAGFTDYNDYQWVVSYYWDLHVNTNGWIDIGYNFLIDRNGVIYRGRGSGNQGSHFSCLNSKTSGICLIGDFRNVKPRAAAFSALKDLLAWEACTYGVNPIGRSIHSASQLNLRHVSGHRNANPAQRGCPSGTVCPGQMLFDRLDSMASATAAVNCLLSQEETPLEAINLYPNPVKDYLQIESPQHLTRIALRNSLGQLVLEVPFQEKLPLGFLEPGLYFLSLYQGPERISNQRLVKI